MTTGEYLDQHFTDEQLKGVLGSPWGLYGLPPEASAFAGHALLVNHYANGGYYPVGGSGVIAESVVPIVEGRGGQTLVNHSVDEILVEDGRAVGVRVTHRKGRELVEKTFFADIILSNAGAHTTYTRMMPEGLHLPFDDAIRHFPNGTANVTLYLGLKDDPAKLGLRGENYWMYDGYDHDAIYAERNALVDGKTSAVYLSFPSMKNPEARGHTAEIIAFIDAEPFIAWKNKPWRRRGNDYEQLKEHISNSLIAFVEARLPGFEDLIDYRELATPITTEHFTNHRNGNIYGLPMIPEKFKATWLGPRTPIRNLYLTGSDAATYGIVGSMMSGVLATSLAMGRPWSMLTIMARAIRFSQRLHAQEGTAREK